MRQYDIINSFTKELVAKNCIACAYLSGSYARKREDEYSNIDFSFALNPLNEIDFYDNYYKILSKYGRIIYHKNKRNKDICIIYSEENGFCLNINIHICDLEKLSLTSDILVLYDPNHYLDKVEVKTCYQENEIGEKIDLLSLKSLEFMRIYKRNDLAIMLDLTSQIHDLYVEVYRYYKDKDNSFLNKKEFLSVLDKNERMNYIKILREIKLDTLKEAVYLMLNEINGIILNFDLNVAKEFDYDFFIYALNIVKKRSEK